MYQLPKCSCGNRLATQWEVNNHRCNACLKKNPLVEFAGAMVQLVFWFGVILLVIQILKAF